MSVVVNQNNVYQTQITAFNDLIYQQSVLSNRLWDEEVIDEILKHIHPDTDILDIGANIGLVTLGVILKAKQQNKSFHRIHCFECDTNSFQLLRINTAPFSTTAIYPFAIGNKFQLCNIQTLDKNEGCNHIYQTIDETGKTQHDYSNLFYTSAYHKLSKIFLMTVPLDSILYQFTKRISVIKIDVEGFECEVLQGAVTLLSQHRPVVIVEAWTVHLENIITFMKQCGYQTYHKITSSLYENDDYIFYPDTMEESQ